MFSQALIVMMKIHWYGICVNNGGRTCMVHLLLLDYPKNVPEWIGELIQFKPQVKLEALRQGQAGIEFSCMLLKG